ncbi:MAG: type II secretion system F family protein [Rhodospirillales bacterium]|nr:type II secretion system F family protein [Rhodospirillales bacterium]
MTVLSLPIEVGASVAVTAMGAGVAFYLMRREHRLDARIRALHVKPETGFGMTDAGKNQESLRQAFVRMLSNVGQWVLRRRMLSTRVLADFEKSLTAAGLRGSAALRLFVGAKIVAFLLLPPLLWLLAEEVAGPESLLRILLPAGGAVAGLILPDFVISRMRDRHAKRLSQELPDALDMMVICTQAGLGLGPTILRVAEELSFSHRSVALEFAQTADELQIMTDAQTALTHFGERSGVESVRRLAATLLQSAQYGTPLSDALRSLSAELRTELVTRFEARAARLPVLLTLPMVLFILPCLFLIVGGPAIIQVMHALKAH